MKKRFNGFDVSGNWQLLIDGSEDSWWDFKVDAVERILEVIKDEGENCLSDYEYEGDKLSFNELKLQLGRLPEEDFYTILDEIKAVCDFYGDFKLYNISDEDEIDFLKEEEDTDDYFDFDD